MTNVMAMTAAEFRTEPSGGDRRSGTHATGEPATAGGSESAAAAPLETLVMTRAECLGRLAGTDVGRIGLSVDAMPVILPMTFALMDDDVVIRASWGDKLDAAVHDRVVCFEADGQESPDGGWSVLVTGRAEIIRNPQVLERAGRLPLRPWSTRPGDRFIRIPAEVVSGRRTARCG
jgi:nitroimidazol reductase NimA-like FMN-containing flavoprotein (pyridoxamine 5'-phosphate oxidase superfamily)